MSERWRLWINESLNYTQCTGAGFLCEHELYGNTCTSVEKESSDGLCGFVCAGLTSATMDLTKAVSTWILSHTWQQTQAATRARNLLKTAFID